MVSNTYLAPSCYSGNGSSFVLSLLEASKTYRNKEVGGRRVNMKNKSVAERCEETKELQLKKNTGKC